jgi:hypothetical protein
MKQLLIFTMLAAALFLAQPAQAQQQDTAKDTTSMHHMEMMQDSTMQGNMMGMCMKMMQSMENDTSMSMSGMQDMMDGEMPNMCMRMCMNMMDGDMDMDKKKMPENKDSQDSTKQYKDEEKQGQN